MNKFFKVNNNHYNLSSTAVTKACNILGYNSVDEYFVKIFPPENILPSSKILIIADDFGALSLAYLSFNPTVLLDSAISEFAINENLRINQLNRESIKFIKPFQEMAQKFDFILLKCPKSTELLKLYLNLLSGWAKQNTQISIGVMIKHMPNNFYKILELYATVKSLDIWKKARLCKLTNLTKTESYLFENHLKIKGEKYISFKSVFSSTKLDLGTDFLLKNMIDIRNTDKVIDLGCGFGAIGIEIKKIVNCTLIFIDESYLSIESAKKNVISNRFENCYFYQNSQLQDISDESINLIVSNPPFHLNHIVTENLTNSLFPFIFQKICQGGKFLLVFNRHLKYRPYLSILFSRVQLIAENEHYKIILCDK